MKVLIAIVNCHTRQAYADAQRETWIPLLPSGVDYRFFCGRGAKREPAKDEVFLDCDDSYAGLPSKVAAITRWALEHDVDFMLKCDDDVVLLPDRFLNSGFEKYDFTGHMNNDGALLSIPWGFCYTLSRKAMRIVSTTTLPNNNNDEAWVSRTLAEQGIKLHHQDHYRLHRGIMSDFITPTKRALRTQKRKALYGHYKPEEIIACCMFIHWHGYHNTPDELVLKELRKVFAEIRKTDPQKSAGR